MVKLFFDFKLGEVELKNRIVMSPMCMYLCEKEDGIATQEHIIHYGARAAGQVGRNQSGEIGSCALCRETSVSTATVWVGPTNHWFVVQGA